MKSPFLSFNSNSFSFFLVVIVLLIIACDKDNSVQLVDKCENTNYTYTADLKTLFDANCTTSNCHDGSNSLADYRDYQGVFADRFKLRDGINLGLDQVTNGRAQLTQAEQDQILCWIKDGAPE